MVKFITLLIYLSIYVGLFATTFYILSFIAYKKKERLMFGDDELPFVTVLIPAYNEEGSIERTIKSIDNSNYPRDKLEILVIDDGSKDKTLEISKKLENDVVRVFHKENGGKGNALNFGISKAKGIVVFTMDADTTVDAKSLKNMTRYFKDGEVMAVTPAMVIDKPKSIWQRVQHIEYLQGLFLRKAFASVNSIYITPGAFSAYRKAFFDKHGGYDVGNITEDLEMSLRIQFNGYIIENCPDAPAYTRAPKTFKELLVQRRRWYFGLVKNMIKYKKIMSPKYGDLGVFVLPVAWASIIMAISITAYFFFKTIFQVIDEVAFYKSINFDFGNAINVNYYIIERALFIFFSNPVLWYVGIFLSLLGFYIYYASRKLGRVGGLAINLPLYYMFFAILFGFWWFVSLIYAIFAKTVKWK